MPMECEQGAASNMTQAEVGAVTFAVKKKGDTGHKDAEAEGCQQLHRPPNQPACPLLTPFIPILLLQTKLFTWFSCQLVIAAFL